MLRLLLSRTPRFITDGIDTDPSRNLWKQSSEERKLSSVYPNMQRCIDRNGVAPAIAAVASCQLQGTERIRIHHDSIEWGRSVPVQVPSQVRSLRNIPGRLQLVIRFVVLIVTESQNNTKKKTRKNEKASSASSKASQLSLQGKTPTHPQLQSTFPSWAVLNWEFLDNFPSYAESKPTPPGILRSLDSYEGSTKDPKKIERSFAENF